MFSSPRKPFSSTKPTIPPTSYQATTPKSSFTPASSPWQSSTSSHSSHASYSSFQPSSPTKERPIFELYGDRLFSNFRPGGFPAFKTSQPPTPASSPTHPQIRPDPAAAATYVDEQLQALRERSRARRAENIRNMAGPGPQRNTRFGRSCKRTSSWLSREERKQSRLRGESLLGEKRREERRRKHQEELHKRRREEQARKLAEQKRLEEQAGRLTVKGRHATYTSQWEWIMNLPVSLPEHELLTTRHLAMPIMRTLPVTSPFDISKADIEAFLMDPTHSEGKTRRERVRTALLVVSLTICPLVGFN